MDNLDYIDTYFTSESSPAEKFEFEKKITEDPVFAEEVAIYLSARELAKEQKADGLKERFKEIYVQYKHLDTTGRQRNFVRKLWPYIAAAAIFTGIIFGISVIYNSPSTKELADKYIQEHFQTLGVTMSGNKDSLQTGLELFNNSDLNGALNQFESIAARDTASTEAIKYAGITCLRLKQYDKAIGYFTRLEKYNLYSNPGKLFHAITLLKRNMPGDKQAAKPLLQQVLQFDLEGKEAALELLDKW